MQRLELDAARAYGALPDTAFCQHLPHRDAAEHERVRSSGVALVADVDGTPIGFLLALPIDGRAHMLEVAVALAHQGRGIGRRLIEVFEDWARAAAFEEATLTTFRDVPWNAPFYARLGYRVVDVGVDRPALHALRADETAAGFDRAARVAMRKML